MRLRVVAAAIVLGLGAGCIEYEARGDSALPRTERAAPTATPSGSLAFSEYEASLLEVVQCLRSRGYIVHGPVSGIQVIPGVDESLVLNYTVETPFDYARFEQHEDYCRSPFESVEVAWLESLQSRD